MKQANLPHFEEILTTLFAGIPYTNYVNNAISNYEGYYASVIYTYLASLGMDLRAEDVTNKGRIDLTIKIDDFIYIIEFKVDSKDKALEQIKKKGYHEKYMDSDKSIFLIGINFDSNARNVANFEWEQAQ